MSWLDNLRHRKPEDPMNQDVIAEFSGLVGNALRAGCDVSVVCIDDPHYLGIYES